MTRALVVLMVALALLVLPAAAAAATSKHKPTPAVYKNCTALNKRYPHGIGKAGARDRTSGTPVTSFRRSTKLYNEAMHFNKGLDRDGDGVACEKE